MGKNDKAAKKGGGGGGGDGKKAAKNDKKGSGEDSNKLKPANSINVRHILCEKASQIQEAMDRLAAGESFDKVYSLSLALPPLSGLFVLSSTRPPPHDEGASQADRVGGCARNEPGQSPARRKVCALQKPHGQAVKTVKLIRTSLGWQIRGAMVKDFETAAFQLPVSKPDKPVYTNPAVKTQFG